jgi:hypothetical protein
MKLTEAIQLRSEFEFITKGYNMPDGSSIDTIEWFIKNGHKSNSLRKGFDEAQKIAKIIKEFSDGCTKKTRSRKQVRTF